MWPRCTARPTQAWSASCCAACLSYSRSTRGMCRCACTYACWCMFMQVSVSCVGAPTGHACACVCVSVCMFVHARVRVRASTSLCARARVRRLEWIWCVCPNESAAPTAVPTVHVCLHMPPAICPVVPGCACYSRRLQHAAK